MNNPNESIAQDADSMSSDQSTSQSINNDNEDSGVGGGGASSTTTTTAGSNTPQKRKSLASSAPRRSSRASLSQSLDDMLQRAGAQFSSSSNTPKTPPKPAVASTATATATDTTEEPRRSALHSLLRNMAARADRFAPPPAPSSNTAVAVPIAPPPQARDAAAFAQRAHALFGGGGGGGDSGASFAMSTDELAAILSALQSGDESATFSALADLTPGLAMGTEETLQNFDANEFASVLVVLLSTMLHNPDILLLTCRAVCHILEALPRSSVLFVRHGVLAPLCEQLRSIQFIDVAEQCMVALHKLSQFFAQPMLAADALGAVLGFVDFFSSSTQRTALRTAANLCAAVTEKDVANVLPSLPALVQLMRSTDVVVASSAVECVATLVLQCRRWPAQLERMVSSEPQVVAGLVRLVGGVQDESVARISPSARALAPPALAALATALPQSLLEMCQAGLPSLIHFALLADSGAHHHLSHVASTSPSVSGSPHLVAGASPSTPVIGSSPLVRRSADDVLRLVALADALLPLLPAELAALFDADAPVSALPGVFGSASTAIAAGDEGEGDDLGDDGAAEDDNNHDDEPRDIFDDVAAEAVGTTAESAPQLLSAWLRRPPAPAEASSMASNVRDWTGEYARDGRVALFKEHSELVLAIGSELLNAVMQVYNGNADASLREKCAQFVVKLSYVANEVQLDALIRELSFSSFVAALLASRRVTLCGAAVALARLAWEKLPFVLPVHYRREGVMSELRTLSERASDSDERWRRVAAAARALLEQDLDAAGALNQSGGSDTLQAMCAALSALASAATTEAASGALDAVAAALLADTRLSVHEFELSGVVSALLAFLEVDGAATIQRAAMLGAALCARNSTDETAGMWLLRLLQQSLLKHADGFRVRRTGDVAGGVSQSVLLLSRALRVQLKPTDASNKTHFAARVMVEPLASIRAVAEFVGARFDESGEPREANASSGGARARAHSNSGGGGCGVNVSEFDIAATVIGDGGDDNDAGLRRSTGVGRSRLRIDVRLGSQRLDTNQTIIQALVAAVLAGGGDSESTNLAPIWTQTHELTYDVVVDSDMLTASSGASDDGTRSPLLRSSTCISAPSEAGELEDFAVLAAAFSSRIALPGAPAALTAALRLITVLRAMHEHPELCMSSDGLTTLRVCPSAVEFENARFDATMAQQLGEPLLLAAGALPSWCRPLVSTPARIVSLATRALYFRATALGHGRLLAALEQRVGGIVVGGRSSSSSSSSGSGSARAEGVQVTRLERAKVRVRRSTILECAYAVLNSECGTTRALLEVEFFDEQGTGSGPTLEFFTHAARELWSTTSWATPLLWRTNGDGSALLPLFPRIYADGVLPARVERLFVFCGRLMARALLDDRRVDLPIALPLAARLAGSSRRYSHATALRVVDAAQALFLDRLERAAAHGDGLFDGAPIEALGLDFTLPGAAQVPLVAGGDGVPVTRDNAAQYVALVRDLTVGRGVAAQCEALVRGFRSVLDAPLDLFTPPELLDLLCGHDEPWSIESLRAAVRVDHGYSALEQGPVAHLLRTLADFDANERRQFLMFATGAPRLPLGGLASTKLTVVKKELPLGVDADHVLPSVSVCAGSLKLPPYSSVAVTRRQLSYAMMNARAFTFN